MVASIISEEVSKIEVVAEVAEIEVVAEVEEAKADT